MADYKLSKLDKIYQVLFPIFDKYPLLTSKNFDYMKFKKAYQIMTDSNIDEKEKDNLLLTLKSKNKPKNYISPI